MIIPFNSSVKFEIMGYERPSKFFTSPNLNSFWKDLLPTPSEARAKAMPGRLYCQPQAN